MKTKCLLSESKSYVIMVRCYEINCMAVAAIFNIDSVMLMLIRRDLFCVFFIGFLVPENI